MILEDRYQAGRYLGNELKKFYQGQDVIVLGLPRGGVPVACEVARTLGAPLDVVVARKIGSPTNPEFGVGAISEENVLILDNATLSMLHLTPDQLTPIREREQGELKRRIDIYRQGRKLPNLEKKVVLVIDDGLATGVTARAALQAVQKHNPAILVFAAPICDPSTAHELGNYADDVFCLSYPDELHSISLWYKDFQQVSDTEVVELLRQAQNTSSFLS